MRKALLGSYFLLDIILPYAVLLYSAQTGQLPGWVSGVSMFFLILVAAVYGYLLIQSFPTTSKAMWKALGQQLFAVALSWVAFWGSWDIGLQQWSVAAVGALLLALGLALLISWRLDRSTIVRLVLVGFGLPLSLAGLGWLWVLRPVVMPWAILTWLLWFGSWLEHTKHRFDVVYRYFQEYYQQQSAR